MVLESLNSRARRDDCAMKRLGKHASAYRYTHNNRRTVRGSVFYVVHAEAIYQGLNLIVSLVKLGGGQAYDRSSD
jgi:hypothetical protein